jgi:hypothetical protein
MRTFSSKAHDCPRQAAYAGSDMDNAHAKPDADIQAIGRVFKNIYSRNYDRHGRGGLTAALRLLPENDRRVLLYGLRRLLDVRIDLAEELSLDGELDEVSR